MTRKSYYPEMLDEWALRLLDLAVVLRQMAATSRANQVTELALHDKKAGEWYDQLERWARRPVGSGAKDPYQPGGSPRKLMGD